MAPFEITNEERALLNKIRSSGPYTDFQVLKRPVKNHPEGMIIKVSATEIHSIGDLIHTLDIPSML